jgi:hypothetical protein
VLTSDAATRGARGLKDRCGGSGARIRRLLHAGTSMVFRMPGSGIDCFSRANLM